MRAQDVRWRITRDRMVAKVWAHVFSLGALRILSKSCSSQRAEIFGPGLWKKEEQLPGWRFSAEAAKSRLVDLDSIPKYHSGQWLLRLNP